MSTKHTVPMTFLKTTKGTVVFKADDVDAPITTLYVLKGHGYEGKNYITVQIEAKE